MYALYPLRNAITSNYTLSFERYQGDPALIEDLKQPFNFHLDLNIDFRAVVTENRYFTMMDWLLELSAFTWFLYVLVGALASYHIYKSYSLEVSRHLLN
jgi:hypothetical protein